MGIGLLIEYLNNSNALIRAQALLKDLCGLDLILLDGEGKNIPLASSKKSSLNQTSNDLVKSLLKNRTDLSVSQNYLDQTSEAGEASDFISKEGMIKIIVPITYNEQTVGFLLTREIATFRLNRNQINSIKAFLNETIRQVINNDFKFLNDFKGSDVSHQKKTLFRVTQFINDNYQQTDLNLDQVSKKNNISYYYLSHLFQKELKTTFSNYLNNLRIDVASRLLKDHSLTVSQVSYSCGFEDPSYFSKVFKKFSGAPPATYRNKLLSKRKIKDN